MRAALAAFALITLASTGHAQNKPAPPSAPPEEEAPVETFEPEDTEPPPPMRDTETVPDPVSSTQGGTANRPEDPADGKRPPTPDPTARPKSPLLEEEVYPTAEVDRPIVLPVRMLEASMAFPVQISPFVVNGVLRARVGVARRFELGARYGLGAFANHRNNTDYTGGNVVAPEAVYQVLAADLGPALRLFIGAQAAASLLIARQFAAGVVLGLPLKLTLRKRFSIAVGRDLASIAISRFAPNVEDPLANQAMVDASRVNSVLPDGEFRVLPEFSFQVGPAWVVSTRFGATAPNFQFSDPPVLLDVGTAYSRGGNFDLGVRAGFAALDRAKDTFFVSIAVALRL